MTQRIIIIHGPQGSGKPLVAQALLQLVPHSKRVVDEWMPFDRNQALKPGDIACTNEPPPYKHCPDGAQILSVDEARRLVGAPKS